VFTLQQRHVYVSVSSNYVSLSLITRYLLDPDIDSYDLFHVSRGVCQEIEMISVVAISEQGQPIASHASLPIRQP
jgi:hypothetical protein